MWLSKIFLLMLRLAAFKELQRSHRGIVGSAISTFSLKNYLMPVNLIENFHKCFHHLQGKPKDPTTSVGL